MKQCLVPEAVKLIASLQKSIFEDKVGKFLVAQFKSREEDSEQKKETWINALIEHLQPLLKKRQTPGETNAFDLEPKWVE